MNYTTIIIPIIIAGLNWFIVARYVQDKAGKIRYFEYISKPAVILALLVWLWSVSHFSDRTAWFAWGLVCALCGDVFLMAPKTRYTMTGGMLAFMGTHIFYIIGLNPYFPPPINPPGIIIAFMIFFTAGSIYWRLIKSSIIRSSKVLSVGITTYIILLSLMLISCQFSYIQGGRWKDIEALLVGCGGLLFFISDTVLAWNLYIRYIPNSKLINRITYHVGQIAIICGIAIHFTR